MKKQQKKLTIADLRKIFRLREKGLGMKEIAELIGSNSQTINNLLNEFERPNKENLTKKQ